MDSTSVDSFLDLNLNLLNPRSEVMNREFKGDHFAEFEEKASVKQENGVLMEELNRISIENKKLNEMLSILYENYNNLQKQYMDLMMMMSSKNSAAATTENEVAILSKKRKAENYNNGHTTESIISDEDSSCKRPKENNNNIIKPKVSRVYVRANSSNTALIVKDGYHWRKYGQKVTRDNPSPRAYFKCSFAPSCPVKKKVQRSAEYPSILVATYEGEHNHPQTNTTKAELSLSPNHIAVSAASSMRSTSPNNVVTLDMIQPAGILYNDAKKSTTVEEIEDTTPEIQQILVQQMASNLTRDPNFTAALAAAISGRFVDQARPEKWSQH